MIPALLSLARQRSGGARYRRRSVPALCVLAALALSAFAAGCSRKPDAAPPPRSPEAAALAPPTNPAIQFTDVSPSAGIRFRHTHGGSGRKYMPETMGSGCAFLDLDNDGWLDVLLLNGRPLSGMKGVSDAVSTAALYRNNRDGSFTDVTRGSGLDVPIYAMGCCAGDYDNDGRDDVFITTCLEPNRLFHNDGGGKFRDVTAAAGVGDRRWGTSCAWVDYDRDGWLDLFVCNYVRYRSLADDRFCSLLPGRKSYCAPEAYDGEACILYHNSRDGTFRDVSQETGIGAHDGKALGVTLLDYNGDGWMDIAVANDETPNFLFHNVAGVRRQASGVRRQALASSQRSAVGHRRSENRHPPSEIGTGGRRFEEIGVETGFAVGEAGKPKAGMGIDAADWRNDGHVGVLVSNFSNEGLSFYREEGGLFSEAAFSVGFGGPSLLTLGFGLFFFDVDNDGFKDAFVANGHINDDIQLLQSNVSYGERNLLFRNRGDGTFEDVSRSAGAPFAYERVSRGAACGDFDNDGDLDILVANNNDAAELLRNDGARRGNWLQVEVVGRGQDGGTNRSGIGVQVRVKAGSVVQTDWVRSGSSYLAQSAKRLQFGLGTAARADWIEVTWTNGARQRIPDLRANQRVVVREGEGLRRPSGAP